MCRRYSLLSAVLLLALVCAAAAAHRDRPTSSKTADDNRSDAVGMISHQPIAFTQNMGQWPHSVLFRADVGQAVMWFAHDANSRVELVGLGRQDYRCNYFSKDNPSEWCINVPNYSGTLFREICPGADATFRESDGLVTCGWSRSTAVLLSAQAEHVSDGSTIRAAGVTRIPTRVDADGVFDGDSEADFAEFSIMHCPTWDVE